jgi:hypothetical protein
MNYRVEMLNEVQKKRKGNGRIITLVWKDKWGEIKVENR